MAIIFNVGDILFEKALRKRQWYRRLAIFYSKIRLFRLITSTQMVIHLVRVPQDVDVLNVRWKPAKWGERPSFSPVHIDSYAIGLCTRSLQQTKPALVMNNPYRRTFVTQTVGLHMKKARVCLVFVYLAISPHYQFSGTNWSRWP